MSKSVQVLQTKVYLLQNRVRRLAESEGKWKTINGRHVLVSEGETPLEALNKSLDDGGTDEKEGKKEENLSKTMKVLTRIHAALLAIDLGFGIRSMMTKTATGAKIIARNPGLSSGKWAEYGKKAVAVVGFGLKHMPLISTVALGSTLLAITIKEAVDEYKKEEKNMTLNDLQIKVYSMRTRLIKLSEDKEDGVWRTIRGRAIFIKKGESVEEAMAKGKKLPSRDIGIKDLFWNTKRGRYKSAKEGYEKAKLKTARLKDVKGESDPEYKKSLANFLKVKSDFAKKWSDYDKEQPASTRRWNED